jgi:hypothetical protein
MKKTSRLTRISLLLFVFFGMDKVLAVVRTIIIGRQFGISAELDVFNAANNLPDLLFALISGGALAIAVGNVVLMLQYSTYSVISPEGCASILWRSADKASEAAAALAITADRLKDFGLIDKIVNEPVGGAHRDPRVMARLLRRSLADSLRSLSGMTPQQLIDHRLERLLSYGSFQEVRA